MTEQYSLSDIRGVGPSLIAKLAKVGVESVTDLIYNFPRKYEDYSQITQIKDLKPGMVTIKAQVKQVSGKYVRRGMHITEAIASDSTGSVRLVWFNQPYRSSAIDSKKEYFIRGNFEFRYKRLSIQSPSMELVSDFPIRSARIVSVYRQTKDLKSTQISKILKEALPLIRKYEDTLPKWITEDYSLLPLNYSLEQMHFPNDSKQLLQAQRRLGFEEVFTLSLAALLNKKENQQEFGRVIEFDERLAKKFVQALPFQLTDSQRKIIWQIYQDFQSEHPMNRLVEGDVGSGKTVIAVMASLMAIAKGMQVAFLAPTEILAKQHYDSVIKLLVSIGYESKTALLTGSLKAQEKKKVLKDIESGTAQLIVGTHALIQEKVNMNSLNLVVIDEQHRFGVDQRKKILSKAGHMPHVLSLSATPIPRSLALTLYGELDISVLDQKPAGRIPVKTKIVNKSSYQTMLNSIESETASGRQVFVICPLIDSEDSVSKSVNSIHKAYQKRFANKKVELLHGKMKSAEKDVVMDRFVAGEVDILVSTTVVEVGVDVPNASIVVIEDAERFGLAQIHQLRGRVGRGRHESYCYLVQNDSTSLSRRLRAVETTNDGFKLAELDLDIRGPGAIYGTLQHGQLDLRVAKLSDRELIANARKAAQEFIERGENLLEYKELAQKVTNLRKVTNLN